MGVEVPRLELVTRRNCHLCEEMAALLRETLEPLGSTFATLDVDLDPGLSSRYSDVVPVLLREGVPVAKIRLTRRQLRRIIGRRR